MHASASAVISPGDRGTRGFASFAVAPFSATSTMHGALRATSDSLTDIRRSNHASAINVDANRSALLLATNMTDDPSLAPAAPGSLQSALRR
jgi:hypothetical protein